MPSPRETAPAARSAAFRSVVRVGPGTAGGLARAAGVIGWLGLALAGTVLVLAAAVAAAALAVGLGTLRAAGRLGGGLVAWGRRRHDPWPVMARADTG